MDTNHNTVLELLDYSKTFHWIDYDILLYVIKYTGFIYNNAVFLSYAW